MPNRHPLASDFQMYYAGTYICRQGPGGYHFMLVAAVTRQGDDRLLENVEFVGATWDAEGRPTANEARWRADNFEVRIPRSGYYRIPEANQPVYLSYEVGNRTNRRGLDPRSMIITSGSRNNARNIAVFLNQCEFPGLYGRDICVNNNHILWKGEHVGFLRDGNVEIFQGNEYVQELVCKQLGKRLGVEQVSLVPKQQNSRTSDA